MVPVNRTEASERAFEALLRRREEKIALSRLSWYWYLREGDETSYKIPRASEIKLIVAAPPNHPPNQKESSAEQKLILQGSPPAGGGP